MSDPMAWVLKASCASADPESWFPDGAGTSPSKAVRRVCERCPVRRTCLEFALVNDLDHGVWGGTTPRERRDLKKRREAQEKGAAA